LSVWLDVCADPLPDEIAAATYFVVAECLTNASRYGQASEIRVRVAREDDGLHLEVADDGVGGADPSKGTGLLGLADRVEVLGGRLDVHSPAGEGTRISAVLPLG
jgi:signal transduction histidine kinase